MVASWEMWQCDTLQNEDEQDQDSHDTESWHREVLIVGVPSTTVSSWHEKDFLLWVRSKCDGMFTSKYWEQLQDTIEESEVVVNRIEGDSNTYRAVKSSLSVYRPRHCLCIHRRV